MRQPHAGISAPYKTRKDREETPTYSPEGVLHGHRRFRYGGNHKGSLHMRNFRHAKARLRDSRNA